VSKQPFDLGAALAGLIKVPNERDFPKSPAKPRLKNSIRRRKAKAAKAARRRNR